MQSSKNEVVFLSIMPGRPSGKEKWRRGGMIAVSAKHGKPCFRHPYKVPLVSISQAYADIKL